MVTGGRKDLMQEHPTVFFVSGKPNGCDWYRLRQPAYKLQDLNLFPVALSSEVKETELEECLEKSDVIVTQHFTEKFLDYLDTAKGNQKIVFDYDDNIFRVSPYNPSYEHHGLSEVDVTLANGEVVHLWKQGERGFDVNRNMRKMGIFQEVLKRADLVTTPSSVLSGVLKQHGAKKTRVIKNCINPKLWSPLNITKDEYIRIGYQGGWSHYEDWLEIGEAIVEVMNKYPKTLLIVMGQHYPGAVKGLPEDRVIVEEWTSIEAYPWKFKSLNIDIGIAPLANNEFNVCKSEIKWEEYSALGIPTIASNIPPYNLAINHHQDGFLADDKKEWVAYLSELIESKNLRENIGNSARTSVLRKYDINEKVAEYSNAYLALFKRELIIA